MRFPVSAVLALALAAVPAVSRANARARGDRAEAVFQEGVSAYASGRFDEARARFAEAARLDPGHRAARTSLARLDVEMRGRPDPDAAVPAPLPRPPLAGDRTLLEELAAFLAFEETIGGAASDLGAARAAQGRVAQLAAERRVARARGRPYPRDAELHALTRRLPSLLL